MTWMQAITWGVLLGLLVSIGGNLYSINRHLQTIEQTITGEPK